MEIDNHLDYGQWKKFVDDHPLGNIYHTPEMFEVYAQAGGYNPQLWAAVENGKVLALHLPVQLTLVGGPFKFLTTRNIDYGSVLAEDSEAGRRGLAALLKAYNKHVSSSPLFTELRNAANQGYIQNVLQECGYQYEDHLNYLLDLSRGAEETLQSFSKSARNRIRKYTRRGEIIVREVRDPEELETFYEIITKTYKHANVPLADISLFKAAFDIMRPKKMIRFTVSYCGNTPTAAQVSLLYKDAMNGWYNGVDRSGGKDCNEFLIWELIHWGIKKGYKVLDFGGAGKPGEEYGVRDFKAKFHGDLVNFGRNTCVHAPLRLKISETSYQTARHILNSLSRVKINLPTQKTSSS